MKNKRVDLIVHGTERVRQSCPVCPGTVNDETELISEIEHLNDQHHILDMLRAIRVVIEKDGENVPDKRGYYVLQLDYERHYLRRWFFRPSELEKANGLYDYLEHQRGNVPC